MNAIEEQIKTLLDAARQEERDEYHKKLIYLQAQVNNLLEGLAQLTGADFHKADPRPAAKTAVRRRKARTERPVTEEQIEAVAEALNSLPPDARHNGVKPKQLKNLLPNYGYKTIGACCRALVTAGRVAEKRGRYQWIEAESVVDDSNGIDREASEEAAQ